MARFLVVHVLEALRVASLQRGGVAAQRRDRMAVRDMLVGDPLRAARPAKLERQMHEAVLVLDVQVADLEQIAQLVERAGELVVGRIHAANPHQRVGHVQAKRLVNVDVEVEAGGLGGAGDSGFDDRLVHVCSPSFRACRFDRDCSCDCHRNCCCDERQSGDSGLLPLARIRSRFRENFLIAAAAGAGTGASCSRAKSRAG